VSDNGWRTTTWCCFIDFHFSSTVTRDFRIMAHFVDESPTYLLLETHNILPLLPSALIPLLSHEGILWDHLINGLDIISSLKSLIHQIYESHYLYDVQHPLFHPMRDSYSHFITTSLWSLYWLVLINNAVLKCWYDSSRKFLKLLIHYLHITISH